MKIIIINKTKDCQIGNVTKELNDKIKKLAEENKKYHAEVTPEVIGYEI